MLQLLQTKSCTWRDRGSLVGLLGTVSLLCSLN